MKTKRFSRAYKFYKWWVKNKDKYELCERCYGNRGTVIIKYERRRKNNVQGEILFNSVEQVVGERVLHYIGSNQVGSGTSRDFDRR